MSFYEEDAKMPGETGAQWQARVRNNHQRRQAEAQAFQEIAEAAAGRALDESWEREIKSIFGEDLDDLQKNINAAADADVAKIMSQVNKAAKRGNYGRAKKIARSNKGKIKAASQKGKAARSGGCAVAAISTGLLLASSLFWGAYEAVAAIIN